jgi:hypothetical protein
LNAPSSATLLSDVVLPSSLSDSTDDRDNRRDERRRVTGVTASPADELVEVFVDCDVDLDELCSTPAVSLFGVFDDSDPDC